jgi:UDP-2,3-diacylglucosamine pyrophosphatase LpxH
MSRIANELTRALNGQFTLSLALDLQAPHKYIIFSDQHKGGGDKADEFRKCKDTYVAALQHYLQNRFTFILLGDVEELWEQGFKKVEKTYQDVLQLEASFPASRYYRIWGNHDDEWMNERNVRKKLARYMPTGALYEAIRFELINALQSIGTVLILHGHQGTFASDKIRWFSRFKVRIYRYIQRLTGIGKETPAKDACLRGKHDAEMYHWAENQKNLILIAGHTHRPVWSSRTHLQKLEEELKELKAGPDTPQQKELIEEKELEVQERERKYPPCEDTEKPLPCYFNTGCCKFDDGDITGIEIEDGAIRLIKWSKQPLQWEELQTDQLLTIFDRIKKNN